MHHCQRSLEPALLPGAKEDNRRADTENNKAIPLSERGQCVRADSLERKILLFLKSEGFDDQIHIYT